MTANLENILNRVWSTAKCLRRTLTYFVSPSEIFSYPDAALDIPEYFSGCLFVNWEDCIGCKECEKACPTNCIYISTLPAEPDEDLGITSNGKKKTEWVLEFDIDMSKCMHCRLCADPCPTQCIYMTKEYDCAVYRRAHLVYHFTPFTPEQASQKRRELEAASKNGNIGHDNTDE